MFTYSVPLVVAWKPLPGWMMTDRLPAEATALTAKAVDAGRSATTVLDV